MKKTKYLLTGSFTFIVFACLYCPIFHAMPRFMDRYDNDAFAKSELKGKCTTCHTNDEGFGQLNDFGKAFAASDYRITDELRKKFTDKFGTAAAKKEPEFDVKAFYVKNCASCHGADGKGGDGMMGMPNFTDAAWQQRRSEERLTEMIRQGKGAMPAWKDKMTDDQLKAMVEFIRKFAG